MKKIIKTKRKFFFAGGSLTVREQKILARGVWGRIAASKIAASAKMINLSIGIR
jgi:hypothetical protein